MATQRKPKGEGNQYTAFISASAGKYKAGFTGGAYGIVFPYEGATRTMWGYGGIRNSEVLFAEGLCAMLDELVIDKVAFDRPDFKVTAFAAHPGFSLYLTKHIPLIRSRGNLNAKGENPDAWKKWKRLDELRSFGKLEVKVPPRDLKSKAMMKKATSTAKQYAAVAHKHGPYSTTEMVDTGEEA